jgi:hypothetical protein
MKKESGWLNKFFRGKQNSPDLNSYVETEIMPLAFEIKDLVKEIASYGISAEVINKTTDELKKIFYSLRELQSLCATKKADTISIDKNYEYYKSKIGELLTSLSNKIKDLKNMSNKVGNNFDIAYAIQSIENKISNAKSIISKQDMPQENSLENVTVESQLPSFFKKYLVENNSYVDVEKLRGDLSTWIRRYGEEKIHPALGEPRKRYIAKDVFERLLMNEHPQNKPTIEVSYTGQTPSYIK